MRTRLLFFLAAAIALWPGGLVAGIIVNPPLPIRHRVTVQMIQTALSDGTSPATAFGDASQRASIETNVDQIWAQAGIDVHFLPTITPWNDTFAYQGDGGERPLDDLATIVSTADAAGVTNPTLSVINEFFVNVVPGFSLLGEGQAAGVANIGYDGTAQFVGDNLLDSASGRESIARVVAHEIGHVLGLLHIPTGTPNLMNPSVSSALLNLEQIEAVFQTDRRSDEIAVIPPGGTGFPQWLPPALAGDYNDDGAVTAADYTVWRNTLNSTTNWAADGNGDREIDRDDYLIWKDNYGNGAAGAAGSPAIPEPGAVVVLAGALAAILIRRRRR